MGSNGRSERNFTGGYNHYDSKGHKTGRSERNFTGGYNHYDSKGRKTGHSERNFTGGYTHYDNHGNKIGSADRNAFGGYTQRDAKGNRVGSSDPTFTKGYSHNSGSEGCYVATCVYGSYDCPEVWVLRRFRDYKLKASWYGRMFVKVYYAVSPILVCYLGNTEWFKNMWKPLLNRMILKLRQKGYEDMPYRDENGN